MTSLRKRKANVMRQVLTKRGIAAAQADRDWRLRDHMPAVGLKPLWSQRFADAVHAYADRQMTWPQIRDSFEGVTFGDVLVELGRQGLKYPATAELQGPDPAWVRLLSDGQAAGEAQGEGRGEEPLPGGKRKTLR